MTNGDVNGDGIVDIFDLEAVGLSYGSQLGGPGWNPSCDLNHDNLIDIFDLAIVGFNYGKTDYGVYFSMNPKVKAASLDMLASFGLDSELLNDLQTLESTGKVDFNPEWYDLDAGRWGPNPDIFNKIWVQKIAFSIYIDKHGMVPWKLEDYTSGELATLYNWYYQTHYGMPGFRDYDANYRYSYAKELVKNTPALTVYAIINDVRDFRHGCSNCPGDLICYAKSLQCVLTTYESFYGGRVSYYGCQSMTWIIKALLDPVNIPSGVDSGWYYGELGYYHSSLIINNIGFLAHGDDIYTSTLDKVPGDHLLMPWDRFMSQVEPCGKFTACATSAIEAFYSELIQQYG
jgi:hypothetical protein